MGIRLAYSSTLETVTCITCGVEYAMPADLLAQYRKEHTSYHCPNGHQQYFTGETEAEKLRKELSKEKERARWAEEANKKITAKLKKTEKRISKGVCPCCNRSFINLQRHMACKHKEYVK